MSTHKEERLKRGMAYCKGCSKDLVDCRCRLDDLQADEVLHEVEPTPPSQIEVDRLIKQARADQLKKLWNATQHDIVPEGTPPRDMSEELHKMIKELEV